MTEGSESKKGGAVLVPSHELWQWGDKKGSALASFDVVIVGAPRR